MHTAKMDVGASPYGFPLFFHFPCPAGSNFEGQSVLYRVAAAQYNDRNGSAFAFMLETGFVSGTERYKCTVLGNTQKLYTLQSKTSAKAYLS
eukprot:1050698-Amphidinium_carterae.3